jgi:hypothetical protein
VSSVQGCVSGPQLAAYIAAHRPVGLRSLCDADRQAVRRWARGAQARVGTADRILIALGLPSSEVLDAYHRPYDNGRCGHRRKAVA